MSLTIASLLIRVFSNDGVLLHSFGCDKNGINRLNDPHGICVSGQYVYVSNDGSDNVSVFTTAGLYVTSFGQKGREEGEFKSPSGICVDQHAIVYVCDSYNKRVQCF